MNSRPAARRSRAHMPGRFAAGAGRHTNCTLETRHGGGFLRSPNRISSPIAQFNRDRRLQFADAMREEFDDPQTYKIIGAAMAVHRAFGCGFLEAVSREALTIELQERGIPFVREARLQVRYRNPTLPVAYVVDFICYDEVLVEVEGPAGHRLPRRVPIDQLPSRRASAPWTAVEFRHHQSPAQATRRRHQRWSRRSTRIRVTSGGAATPRRRTSRSL